MDEYAARRNEMVRYQIALRGVSSPAVLDAMRTVPREVFVPPHLGEQAYEDSPLPIAAGQTISQPYIVAYMIDALELEGPEKVLDVGAGSGYAAAVLSRIAAKVYAIERIGELADGAPSTLANLGYDNVEVRHGDGSRGWPEEAPFDAIVVAAGASTETVRLEPLLGRIGDAPVVLLGKPAMAPPSSTACVIASPESSSSRRTSASSPSKRTGPTPHASTITFGISSIRHRSGRHDTLQALREHHAPDNKAVVWAHNSHVGNAAATAMSSRGQINIGQLCREHYGADACPVGFGTNSGTVAAASDWDGPMEIMAVRPAMAGSYERLFHETSLPGFLLGLRGESNAVRDVLGRPRSASSTGPTPNMPATISRPSSPDSSTSTYG